MFDFHLYSSSSSNVVRTEGQTYGGRGLLLEYARVMVMGNMIFEVIWVLSAQTPFSFFVGDEVSDVVTSTELKMKVEKLRYTSIYASRLIHMRP